MIIVKKDVITPLHWVRIEIYFTKDSPFFNEDTLSDDLDKLYNIVSKLAEKLWTQHCTLKVLRLNEDWQARLDDLDVLAS